MFITIIQKNFTAFLRMVFNYLKTTEPIRGESLRFTIKSPGVPGTHLVDLPKTTVHVFIKFI